MGYARPVAGPTLACPAQVRLSTGQVMPDPGKARPCQARVQSQVDWARSRNTRRSQVPIGRSRLEWDQPCLWSTSLDFFKAISRRAGLALAGTFSDSGSSPGRPKVDPSTWGLPRSTLSRPGSIWVDPGRPSSGRARVEKLNYRLGSVFLFSCG